MEVIWQITRLLFTRTTSGGTAHVWVYDGQADGFFLDDRRTPLLADDRLGPDAHLNDDEHEKNNLPDIAERWPYRDDSEHERARTEQGFCVPKDEIAAADHARALPVWRGCPS